MEEAVAEREALVWKLGVMEEIYERGQEGKRKKELVCAMKIALFDTLEERMQYKIQQYCGCRVIMEEDKNVCEAFFRLLTGSYWFLLDLGLVVAGSMNDEWDQKIAVDEWHFGKNIEWAKKKVMKYAAEDTTHLKQTLEKLRWMISTMENDLEAQKLEMQKLLEKIESGME